MSFLQDINPFSNVKSAVKRASRETGVDFDYLMKTAERESSLNPKAKARTSSASGLFQFIEQTWLGVLKKEGAEHGLGEISNQIKQTRSGKYVVPDQAVRKKILDLRYDPQVSATMAGALTRQNGEILSRGLGRQPNEAELYMAHFMGGEGALRFIQLAQTQPNAKASKFFPAEARANKPIFYAGKTPRTMSQVYQALSSKHGSSTDVLMAEKVKSSEATSFQIAAQSAAPLPPEKPQPFTRKEESNQPVFHAMFGPNSLLSGPKVGEDMLTMWAQTRRQNPSLPVERPDAAAGLAGLVAKDPAKGANSSAEVSLDAAPLPERRPYLATTAADLANARLATGASLFARADFAKLDASAALEKAEGPEAERNQRQRKDGAIEGDVHAHLATNGDIGSPIDLGALTPGVWSRQS